MLMLPLKDNFLDLIKNKDNKKWKINANITAKENFLDLIKKRKLKMLNKC